MPGRYHHGQTTYHDSSTCGESVLAARSHALRRAAPESSSACAALIIARVARLTRVARLRGIEALPPGSGPRRLAPSTSRAHGWAPATIYTSGFRARIG